MTWNNYFDSNKAFTVIVFNNAAYCIRKYLTVPIPPLSENFAVYDELQNQLENSQKHRQQMEITLSKCLAV
jgi:hypothetical protein